MARSWRQTEGRAKGRLGACGARRGPPASNSNGRGLSSGSSLLAEMNGSEGGLVLSISGPGGR